jgi:hypothetical protein
MTDQNELWEHRAELMSAALRGNLQASNADRQQAAEEAARQVTDLDETDREQLWAARGKVLGSAMIGRAAVPNQAVAVLALTEAAKRDEQAEAERRAKVDQVVADAVREALATTRVGESAKPPRSAKRPAARSTVTERHPGCPCLQGPDYSLVGCLHLADGA